MRKVRVLVVDDSRTMRLMIRSVLEADPAIEVVGEAADPYEAREAIKALEPNVVTLDVEMPKMDGIEFLEKLMRLRPTAVVMVSDHTSRNTETTLRALEVGAVDCVGKPRAGEARLFADLAEKVKAASLIRFRPPTRAAAPAANPQREGYSWDGRLVAIGSSTGGVEALCTLLQGYPAKGPAMLITQHMPAHFTKSLANRLNNLCDATVTEAQDGAPIVAGTIYVAPGGETHLTVTGGDRKRCRLVRGPAVNGHRPSVDVMFGSIAKVAGAGAVGVILTGMGRDGAEGLLAMRRAGALTLGQDENTSLIYGMPKAAFETGGVERQLPLDKIGAAILKVTQARSGSTPCPSQLLSG